MTKHYTRNTVSDTKWCNQCKAFTERLEAKERAARLGPAAVQEGFKFW